MALGYYKKPKGSYANTFASKLVVGALKKGKKK